MLHFGIKKVDEIFSQNKKFYIFCKGRKGTGYAGRELRFCEYRLLKNLLDSGKSCAVVHMSFGDTFKNMTYHLEGWKQEYLNVNNTSKEFEEFDNKAYMHIIKYNLFEFKIYNNNPKTAIEYIRNFLLGKVKYIFITNVSTCFNEDLGFIQEIFNIAMENDVTFILRTGTMFIKLPNLIQESLIEFNKDKETEEFTITCVDRDGKIVTSESMKIHKNEGIGYIE